MQPPNYSFKPNLLRYSNGVAEKACHAVASTAQVGLTQVLDGMKIHTIFVLLLAATAATSSIASPSGDNDAASMACNVGPLPKRYGGTQWVVYSCSDSRTVVIHSAAGNPAMPFYFMLFQQDGNLRLYGEGTGEKKYTEAAFKELEPMTVKDVAALVQETLAVKSDAATN